jgi:hypothetical protein
MLDLQAVPDLDSGSGKPGDPKRPGASMKIDEQIKAGSTDRPDCPQESSWTVMAGEHDDVIQVRVSRHQVPVRFFHDIGEVCPGVPQPEGLEGGAGHDHIADAAKPDQQNSVDDGSVNP